MIYPDFDSDEGLSDDDDYFDFQERVRQQQRRNINNIENLEADNKKRQLQSFFSAIISGKSQVVIEELEKGLNVNANLENGWTPLLLAASVCNPTITSELIKRGANINSSRNGCTALMLACNNCSEAKSCTDALDVVKELIEHGADAAVADRKRKTVLMYAANNSNVEVVKYLLPLSNKDAKDNQKWTALFWAVEGNQPEIVQLLLQEGFSYLITDIRQNTPVEIAEQYEFEEILKLFPQNENDKILCTIFNKKIIDFEENFEQLKNNEKPQFYIDICKILYGVRCECLMPILEQSKMNLSQFLSISDKELKEIGIELPYQRNRILSGLYRFHKHPFNPRSLKVVPKNDLFSNIDVSCTILSSIKQIIAMEASLKFMIKNCDDKILPPAELQEVSRALINIRNHINKLKLVVSRLMEETEVWDLSLKPADLIVKRKINIPWFKLISSISIISLIVYKCLM